MNSPTAVLRLVVVVVQETVHSLLPCPLPRFLLSLFVKLVGLLKTMRFTEEKAMENKKDEVDASVEQEDPQPMDETAEDVAAAVVLPEVSAAEEVKASTAENGGGTADGGAASQEGAERSETSSFARLVKGWEALAQAGARNVQRARENENFQPLQMLQSLSLCGAGDGLARIGGPTGDASGDPFEPIMLRHTRSTPQQYQPMFPDDKPPAPVRLEHMRRSSSTPSSSAFRRYSSSGSAFGAHLRSMPYLGGPGDRSAFTLPSQRNSFTSLSDSGVRYSAFDPVWLPQSATDAVEDTAIEVTPAESEETPTEEEGKSNKSAASRAARFLRISEGRNTRRRKRRDGRENPARPTSISVSSQGSDQKSKTNDAVEEESKPTNPSASSTAIPKSTIDVDISTTRRTPTPSPQFPASSEGEAEDNAGTANGASGDHYQQLDSDIDEEYEHYQRIETSLHTESPTPIPSPAYQKFEDEQVVHTERGTEDSGEAEGGNRTPTVRIRVSSAAGANSSLTPNSQDSGNQSPGTIRSSMTGNTSAGHTTVATSTSATTSSGHMSFLSSVSETDMEVMETNNAGKMRVRQQRKLDSVVKRGDADGSMSVHSSSTGSTTTNGYVALVGSPAPLRDGASLPVDRFFDQSRISVAHSVSNISGSSGSSGSGTLRTGEASKSSSGSSRSKKALNGQGSPASVSSDMATTNSPSAGEEPPQFVSYLEEKKETLRPADDNEERESSPAEIVGYSEMVFEAANAPGQGPQKPALIRPMQKRDGKDRSGRYGSRPPLSPIKGLRTTTTPPPSNLSGPDSTSPAYHQLSPPRNIIDHRMGAGLSKPYVLRSSARAGDGHAQMFASPEFEQIENSSKGWAQNVGTSLVCAIVSPEASQAGPVYTYTLDESQNLGPMESTDPIGRICEEMSIEVNDAPVVSPEKGA